MISKQKKGKNLLFALSALLSLLACAQPELVDKDAKEIEKSICRLSNIDEVSRRLRDIGIEPHLIDEERQLNAIKPQEKRSGLVSSTIVITLQYSLSRTVTSCSVRVVHTGP